MNNLEPQQPQAQPQPAQKSASPPPSAPPGQPTQPPAPSSSSSLSSMSSSSLSQQAAQPAAAQSPSPVYHFKVLVPAAAAGRIIGKGGNAIVQLQKDAGARIKLSKASEFYPGTTERVCLISGPIEGILKIIESIVKSLTPDHLSRPNISSSPPNSSNNNNSHTNSTTNTNNNNHNNNNVSNSVSTYGQMLSSSSTATSSTAVATALHLSRPASSLSPPGCNPNTSLTPVGRSISPAPSVTSDMNSAQIIETIKLVLRVSGYGEDAVSEISSGMSTLASYGVLGVGLGLL